MITFIVNPLSAGGRGQKVWSKLEPILNEKGIQYAVHFTEYPAHARELVKTVFQAGEVQAVVAVGGDGTVHEVAQELVGTEVPLGFIPCGSGNDFARALRIPVDCVKALERILTHRPHKIDTADINGHYFVNGAGVGFDAAVAKLSNASKMKCWLNYVKLGRFAYAANALRMLSSFRPTDVVLTIDGERVPFSHVWLVAVCNVPYYAGGMKICPQAAWDDGRLDVCIVHNMRRVTLLSNLTKVFSGSHVSVPGVTMFRARTVSVEPAERLYVHTDGECYLTTPVTMTIHSNALNVL